MADYYWEIITKDGDTIKIPPAGVEVVKRRWQNNEPINLPNRSIPPNQIKDFRQTSEVYGQPLLDAVAHAFNDPVLTENGIKTAWVKKPVSQRELAKLGPAYKPIANENGMAIVAFRLPVHMINLQKVTYCTENELQLLT